MDKHPPDTPGAPGKSSEITPLITRIIRREQDLEAAVAACRSMAEEKAAAAREEAVRILEGSLVESGEEARLLLAAAGEEARAEADTIRRHSLSRAERILTEGRTGADPFIDEILKIVLPRGEGDPPR